MNIDVLGIIIMGVLGLLVGSFTNVLIWRLPRGESIAFPPSHCPHCDHPLAVKDLVPLFSWLALRGKCRYCGAPINPRYPIVEAVSGLAYALIAFFFPLSIVGAGLLGLCFFFTILLAASVIDAETYTIPDALTIPGVVMGLAFGGLATYQGTAGLGVGTDRLPTVLPGLLESLAGALMGAGLLVVIDLYGSWVLRRFRERQYPDMPLGYQQIALGLALGALVGGLLNQPWHVAAMASLLGAVLSTLANMSAKKVIRIPEVLTLGLALVSVVLSSTHGGRALMGSLYGALAGAGAASLLAGVYWWARASDVDDGAPADPSAMGFGDVKLAAVIGAFLGFGNVLVALGVAIVAGAVLGIVQRLVIGENRLKFGPYLAVGALVAMLWGQPIAAAYRHLVGLG